MQFAFAACCRPGHRRPCVRPDPGAAPVAATPAALSDNLPIPDAPAPASAKAWIVMDYATGQVLAGENITTPSWSRPASPR